VVKEYPMPSHLAPYAVGVVLMVCAVLALVGFGADEPGPVAALLLSMVVTAGGYYLRSKPADA
jgi:hypothetical protein